MSTRSIRRDTEERTVIVREVNMIDSRVTVQDNYSTLLYVSMHVQDALLTIPAIGETWIVRRKGNDWYLVGRQENDISNLSPGDKRIDTSATLYINAGSIVINGENLVTVLQQQLAITPSNVAEINTKINAVIQAILDALGA